MNDSGTRTRGGHFRRDLEEESSHLRSLYRQALNELQAANDALVMVHERCNHLLDENRTLKKQLALKGVVLPGWNCMNPECRVFNSDEKERLAFCRSCGDPRPKEESS